MGATFRATVGAYAKPGYMILIGILLVVVFGAVGPMYGWWIQEAMIAINKAYVEVQFGMDTSPIDETLPWCGWMLLACVVISVTKGISMVLMAYVSENIVAGVRRDMYEAVMRKDIGWHDDRFNSAGVMTATLASDVQLLNGVSSEGLSVQIEALVAVLSAMIMAFYFSWPMALCTIGILPFLMIAATIAAKADNENMLNIEEQKGSDEGSDDSKQSQILCSDSIQHYKTVASFGNDQLLIDEFSAINIRQAKADDKAAKWYALSLAISVAVQNGVFALLYLAIGELAAAYPDTEACR